MPPRESLASSFPAVADGTAVNEVVCPLKNQDGTNCRKRCVGEKKFRSMQEHIRRAHPDHYIPKLPATEESFKLMISTHPSSDRSRLGPQYGLPASQSSPETPSQQIHRPLAEITHYNGGHHYLVPNNGQPYPSNASSAAAALTQLQSSRGDTIKEYRPPSHMAVGPPYHSHYTASADRSPPRSSTLPPISSLGLGLKPGNRPIRRSPPTYNVLKPRHERRLSKDHSVHGRRQSYDRKAQSAEPENVKYGKRWEDLIDAAANATEQVTKQQQDQVHPRPPFQHDLLPPPRLGPAYGPSVGGMSSGRPGASWLTGQTAAPHMSPPSLLGFDRDRDRHSLPPNLASTFRFPAVHTASPLARQVTPPSQFPPLPGSDRLAEEPTQKSMLYSRLAPIPGRPRSATAQGTLQRSRFMNAITENNNETDKTDDERASGRASPFGRSLPFPNSPAGVGRAGSPGLSVAKLYGTPPHRYRTLPPVGPAVQAPVFGLPTNGLSLGGPKGIDGRPVLPPPTGLQPRVIELGCVVCRSFRPAASGFACSECISGVCASCVEGLGRSEGKRTCPACGAGAQFRRVALELR